MSKTRRRGKQRKRSVKPLLFLPPHKKRILNLIFKRTHLIWILLLLLVAGALYWYIFKDFPSPSRLASTDVAQTTKIFDRQGELLFDIYIDKNRTVVPLSNIPKVVQEATIAIEDKEFYKHIGINPVGGMLRALREILFRQQLQGGSTITQQLVKTVLLTPERTLKRKIKEVILALLVEARYSKEQILELYLNHVPYGGTAWGIEAAAERYFGIHVKDLTLAQASLLAGLPQAPTFYSPFGARPELAKTRQHAVLTRMAEDGYITQEQADEASAQELIYRQPTTDIKAPHFVMYVKEQLVEKYGEKLVEQGGLRVTTTLDLPLQEFAQATVSTEVAKLAKLNVTNGAAMVTRAPTGEILTMVGSIDYFASASGTFNVTTALRQPGSAIKPINYALGLDSKIVTPATVFNDQPTCFASTPSVYCPKNYDGKFHGPVQLRFALGNSYNIPAVKMLKLNSPEKMVASASAFGITSLTDPSRYGLSLTLGGGEIPMAQMVTAFGVFANGGIQKNLVSILKVEDAQGKILDEYKNPNLNTDQPSSLLISGERVISAETAFLISHILLDQNARSAAFGSSFLPIAGHPAVSVKTGTTDDLRDNWTIGFTHMDAVVASWVGNNDNSPMNPYLTSGITGAAPIWNKIMSHYLKDKKEAWPKQPEGITGLQVCPISGLLPQEDNACGPRYEYFIKGTEPKERENLKQSVTIDNTTQKIAKPDQTDNVSTVERLIIKDAFGPYCIDCPHDGDPAQMIK
ncbi:MAG: transglycosylase domain-containing protein [Patescibacteria group bacterium]